MISNILIIIPTIPSDILVNFAIYWLLLIQSFCKYEWTEGVIIVIIIMVIVLLSIVVFIAVVIELWELLLLVVVDNSHA